MIWKTFLKTVLLRSASVYSFEAIPLAEDRRNVAIEMHNSFQHGVMSIETCSIRAPLWPRSLTNEQSCISTATLRQSLEQGVGDHWSGTLMSNTA